MSHYALADFVADLKAISAETTGEEAITRQVIPLAKQLVSEADWSDPALRECDPGQGFGITILNEETDNALLVEVICWLPERGVAPHDHQTWGVVVGIEGEETNVDWRRNDDGSRPDFADLSLEAERVIGPGDACAFMPDDIHGVRNTGEAPSLSLHVYGYSPASRDRSEFDPLTKTRRPCPQRVRRRV